MSQDEHIKALESIRPTWLPSNGSLLECTRLNLAGKKLSHLPLGVSLLTYLYSLRLENNQLSSLPDEITALTRVSEIHLGNNSLDTIPSVLFRLLSLRELRLEGNRISVLPTEVSLLTLLNVLCITGNSIDHIPISVRAAVQRGDKLLNVEALGPSWQPDGSIMASTCMTMANLAITKIPDGISLIIGMKFLSLRGNQLPSFSPAIALLTNLTALYFNDNKLTNLPSCITNLQKLHELRLGGNKLSSLPPEIAALTMLSSLHIQDNPMSELPPWILSLKKLEHLSIENQGYAYITHAPTGIASLPCWTCDEEIFGTLSVGAMLRTLKLYNIAEYLGNEAQKVDWNPREHVHLYKEMSFSGKGISALPSKITLLTELSFLRIDGNKFTSLPTEISSLSSLVELHLFKNSQITELPIWISSLTGLKSLVFHDKSAWIYKSSIKRAPSSLKTLPFWNAEWDKEISWYDPIQATTRHSVISVPSVLLPPRGAQRKDKPTILEEECCKIQTLITYDPGNASTSRVAFLKGDIFRLASPTPTGGLYSVKVPGTGAVYHIDCTHSILLEKGECATSSYADQELRQKALPQSAYVLDIGEIYLSKEGSDSGVRLCIEGVLCGLCFGELNNPHHLPCQHVFCLACIKSSMKKSKQEPPYSCPLCRKLVYVDEESAENLSPYQPPEFIPEIMSPRRSISRLDRSIDLTCQASSCKEDASFFCKDCGESSRFCKTHIVLHDSLYANHTPEPLAIERESQRNKSSRCPWHPQYSITYHCSLCPEQPMKCAQCAIQDRVHMDTHDSLEDLDEKMNELVEYKLSLLDQAYEKLQPEKQTIEEEIMTIKLQQQREMDQYIELIEEIEKRLIQLKEDSRKEMEATSSAILRPLENAQKLIASEMQRIQTAKEALQRIMETPEKDSQLVQIGNAFRFTNQALYPKLENRFNIHPKRIVSKPPRDLLNEMKRLSEEFAFGISSVPADTKIEKLAKKDAKDACHRKNYSIYTVPSQISAVPTWSAEQTSKYQVEYPWGVCVNPKNNLVYISDHNLQTISIFDRHLSFLSSHPTGLSVRKHHHGPRDIAMSRNGLLAVADTEAHSVRLFTSKICAVNVIGGVKGEKNGELNRPYSVSFDSRGDLYVADSGNLRIQKFDKKGNFLCVIGSELAEGGLLSSLVCSVAVNEEDDVLVLCSGSDKVRIYRQDGTFANYITLPKPVNTDGRSSIFRGSKGIFGICDSAAGTITLYNYEGLVQREINLDGCVSACFGPRGTLYATSLIHKVVLGY